TRKKTARGPGREPIRASEPPEFCDTASVTASPAASGCSGETTGVVSVTGSDDATRSTRPATAPAAVRYTGWMARRPAGSNVHATAEWMTEYQPSSGTTTDDVGAS